MQEPSQLERKKVRSVQRMRFNQSERLAVESTEAAAGKRGQATADARQTSCRVSWRVVWIGNLVILESAG